MEGSSLSPSLFSLEKSIIVVDSSLLSKLSYLSFTSSFSSSSVTPALPLLDALTLSKEKKKKKNFGAELFQLLRSMFGAKIFIRVT